MVDKAAHVEYLENAKIIRDVEFKNQQLGIVDKKQNTVYCKMILNTTQFDILL